MEIKGRQRSSAHKESNPHVAMLVLSRIHLLLLLATASSAEGRPQPRVEQELQQHAFRSDMVRRAEERAEQMQSQDRQQKHFPLLEKSSVNGNTRSRYIDSLLIEKAVPLNEYNAQSVSEGGKPLVAAKDDGLPEFMRIPVGTTKRRLDEDADDDADDDDSYYLDADSMYDFDSYSLKYTTCQKVQRFSSSAVANGEYSALITNDIVLLRLCPERMCSDSSEYGCKVGYGDYVISLDDYLRVRMQHETDKQRNLCGFCEACNGGYTDEYSGYNTNNNNGRRRLADDDDYFAADDDGNVADDDAVATDDAATDDDGSACSMYSDLCENYGNWCLFDDDEDEEEDEDGYLAYNSYQNYFGCVEVDQNLYASPRCDPYSSQISMAIFYDEYCSQFAGNDINLNEQAGVNFRSDIFDEFHSGECIECGSNAYPPYYNANNNMCNKMYQKSGKCNTYLAYDFGDYDNSDTLDTTCAYVESIRDGRYDKTGMLDVQSSNTAKVTLGQQVALAVICLLCCGLAVYSCYLHHAITNVLLKSISHGKFLEKSNQRRSSRGRGGGSRDRRGRSRGGKSWTSAPSETEDESTATDWESSCA